MSFFLLPLSLFAFLQSFISKRMTIENDHEGSPTRLRSFLSVELNLSFRTGRNFRTLASEGERGEEVDFYIRHSSPVSPHA